MRTRTFFSGNSLAVRIPKDLAVFGAAQEVSIERFGQGLLILPVAQRTLKGLGQALAMFPEQFMADGRQPQEQAERVWPSTQRSAQ